MVPRLRHSVSSLFFNDTATTEIYTLSLHDALPIFKLDVEFPDQLPAIYHALTVQFEDRKSTRLNSSHPSISYAVFCLKTKTQTPPRKTLSKKTCSNHQRKISQYKG